MNFFVICYSDTDQKMETIVLCLGFIKYARSIIRKVVPRTFVRTGCVRVSTAKSTMQRSAVAIGSSRHRLPLN